MEGRVRSGTVTKGQRQTWRGKEGRRIKARKRKGKIPCFNHRPWETPAVVCLKGSACPFLHADAKPEGHVYRKPSPRGKSRGRGGNRGKKLRRKPVQAFMGTIGQFALAAAAISSVSSIASPAEALVLPGIPNILQSNHLTPVPQEFHPGSAAAAPSGIGEAAAAADEAEAARSGAPALASRAAARAARRTTLWSASPRRPVLAPHRSRRFFLVS